jgi:hypothetical protein
VHGVFQTQRAHELGCSRLVARLADHLEREVRALLAKLMQRLEQEPEALERAVARECGDQLVRLTNDLGKRLKHIHVDAVADHAHARSCHAILTLEIPARGFGNGQDAIEPARHVQLRLDERVPALQAEALRARLGVVACDPQIDRDRVVDRRDHGQRRL